MIKGRIHRGLLTKLIMNMKYILNTDYFLVNDKNRILLTTEYDNGLLVTFIHPIHAVLLSYFSGNEDIVSVSKRICSDFRMSEEEFYRTIQPLIENEDSVNLKYDNHVFSFPPKVLVKNDSDVVRVDLKADNYMISPPYDFQTIRLNVPRSIMFVVNTKCYTDCIYCYADKQTKYRPLETEDILNLIDQTKRLEIGVFDLSGGEVLLQKDCDIILKKLIGSGYNPYISTKVPVSQEQLEMLKNIGITRLQYSVDSLIPNLQKTNLGVKTTYINDIKKSIDYADKLNIKLIIKSTLTKDTLTVEGLNSLFEYLVTLRNIEKYTFTPVGYSHFKSYELYNQIKPTFSQIKEVKSFIESKYGDVNFEINWDLGAMHSINEFRNPDEFNSRALCTGNVTGLIVLPDGKVTICEELYWNEHFIIGDITKNSIEEIWNSPKAKALFNLAKGDLPNNSVCNKCEAFDKCRHRLGVCWKEVIACYGKDNWGFPDPRCPLAPEIDSKTKKNLIYD